MAKQTQIDFKQIRAFDGDRRKGFEELICQLARRKPPADPVEFRRVEGAGGDGGVEAYWMDSKGQEHGVQAKYFLATKDIDWAQVDKSVKAALEQHPALVSYVVAVACDLTDRSGKLGRGKTGWQHWETHKETWETIGASKGMKISFLPWTKSDIVDELASHADRRGLTLFWFNADIFDEARFKALFEQSRADLGERFHPEDNVSTTLVKAFEGMRRSPAFVRDTANWFSRIPSAVDLVRSCELLATKPAEEDIIALRDATNRLRAIGPEIEAYGLKQYPALDWRKAIEEVWPAESKIRDFIDGISTVDEREKSNIRDVHQWLGTLSRDLDTNVPFVTQEDYEPPGIGGDRARLVIVRGQPGSGKSHLFADAVSSALEEKAPAVLMLGQNFLGDIRKSFLRSLGMPNEDFEVTLQALDAAGELAGQRTLVLIDALNEAGELRVWPSELAGFASDVLKFDHIALGLSLRPEYFGVLIPEALRKSAKIVTHRGIETAEEQEQAAIQYFEKRGITRPTVPWLAPEFSNFLFLRTVCDAIAVSGKGEFPRGLRGSLDVLKYYLDSVDTKMRREFPGVGIPKDAVTRSVAGVAALMAERKQDFVDLTSASTICTKYFGSDGPRTGKNWFNILVSEGVFRSDHSLPKGDTETEDPFAHVESIIRFSYQRFSDHLIVRALLAEVTDIGAAFAKDGKLSYLLKDKDWRWSSLWQAIAVQIPEKFSRIEIFDATTSVKDGILGILTEAFSQSLLWRSPKAFTDRTLFYFNGGGGSAVRNQTEILLRLATVKDHPWNADFLHKNLDGRSLAQRDSSWSVYLNRNRDDYGEAVPEIINWCLRAPIEKADEETLRLAAITLAWFFTTSSRFTRDTATKALVRVLVVKPAVGTVLLGLFKNVNDLYVLERVCCAVYAATVRTIDQKVIREAAIAIFETIFDRPDVPLDISLRDYSKGVIDYALGQSCLPDTIDLSKCRAPFKSAWPITIPTEKEVKKIAKTAGDDTIRYSAGGMGDFGRYKVEPAVGHFTSVPLSEERPLNAEERKAKFETLVAAWPDPSRSAYLAFATAHVALSASMKMATEKDGKVGVFFEYDPDATVAFQTAAADLSAALDDKQQADFDALASAIYFPASVPYQSRNLPPFDAEGAKRWVVVNAYQRGWTQKLFPEDRHYDNSRGTRARVERIGKKYQWLALRELQARLSDNVWSIKNYPDEATVYDHPADNWFVRDIEPSFLVDKLEVKIEKPWWLNGARPLEPFLGEVSEWPFSEKPPNGSDWLNVTDPQGRKWLLLYSLWSQREAREGKKVSISTVRDVFVRISTIIVESKEADAVVEKLRNRRLADPSGHENIEWTDGPYLFEYPWRNTWGPTTDVGFEEESWRPFEGIKYVRPVARHVWESHLDASLSDGSSTCVPHPWIGRELGIRPDLDLIGACKNAKGETVFLDPAYGTKAGASCVVQPDSFFDFLSSRGLECIWIVAGERNAYPSGETGDYHCRSFAGLHRFERGRWASEEWYDDTLKDKKPAQKTGVDK